MRHFLLILLVLPLTACELVLFPIACTDEGRAAITLHILESGTGAPAAAGASVIVRSEDYEEIVVVPSNASVSEGIALAFEMTGLFDLTVSKPGYHTWTEQRIRVGRSGRCNRLESVTLNAHIRPL